MKQKGHVLFMSGMKMPYKIVIPANNQEQQDLKPLIVKKKIVISFGFIFCICGKWKFLLVKLEFNFSVRVCDFGKVYFNITCQHVLILTHIVLFCLLILFLKYLNAPFRSTYTKVFELLFGSPVNVFFPLQIFVCCFFVCLISETVFQDVTINISKSSGGLTLTRTIFDYSVNYNYFSQK